MKKALILILAAVICGAGLVSCNADGNADVTTEPVSTSVPDVTTTAASDEKIEYSVSVRTVGGLAIAGQKVYVYENGNDLIAYGITDADGNVSFKMKKSENYALRFDGTGLEGYDTSDAPLTSPHTDVTLNTVLRDASTFTPDDIYTLGSVVHDFVFTDTDGKEHKISELLKSKNAIILNFWYINCNFCVKEFPHFEAVYGKYADDVAFIALDPLASDTENGIKAFKAEKNLTFPTVRDTSGLCDALRIAGYPETVVIDRYGVVCLRFGTITEEAQLDKVFMYFAADEYTQTLFKTLSDVPIQ